jgi:hypothetical protein
VKRLSGVSRASFLIAFVSTALFAASSLATTHLGRLSGAAVNVFIEQLFDD